MYNTWQEEIKATLLLINDLQEGAKKHGKQIRVIIEREIKVYVGHKTPLVEGENRASPSLPRVSGNIRSNILQVIMARSISAFDRFYKEMFLNSSEHLSDL